jgi:hypothetical protein
MPLHLANIGACVQVRGQLEPERQTTPVTVALASCQLISKQLIPGGKKCIFLPWIDHAGLVGIVTEKAVDHREYSTSRNIFP